MKVILRQSVSGLGEAGKVVQVADGYGRNYLIPRQLAYAATQGNVKRAQQEATRQAKEAEKKVQEERVIAEKLENVSVTIAAHAGEEGKLFGSVSVQSIVDALAAQGFEIDKKHIELETPIKELGVFPVKIRFSHDVSAEIRVWVVKE